MNDGAIPVGDEQEPDIDETDPPEPRCEDGIPCSDHEAAANGCNHCLADDLSDEDWIEVNARCLDAMVADCYADEDHLRDILRERMERFSYAERLETAEARPQ